MLKKSAIFGLVLLITGMAVLRWITNEKRKEQQQITSYKYKSSSETDEFLRKYNEWLKLAPEDRASAPSVLNELGKTKTEARIREEQQERLKTDLGKLAAGEMPVHPFADILYGENWQNELSKYKSQKELREFIFTGAIVCMATGGITFCWCLLLWTARLLIRVMSHLSWLQKSFSFFDRSPAKLFTEFFSGRGETIIDEESAQTIFKKGKKNPEHMQPSSHIKSQIEKYSAALLSSGWQNPALLGLDSNDNEDATIFSVRSKFCSNNWGGKSRKKGWRTRPQKNAEKMAVLLSDEKTVESEQSLKKAKNNLFVNAMQLDTSDNIETNGLWDSRENTSKLEASLKTQAENLEKQIAEFKQMAQNVQQTALEHSKPLNNAIQELIQQVSAIREYAAYQQDRVEKLQDGYDWNIIRTFCLRVIRCIDNLENRISQLSEQVINTNNLEEVRDELLFTLESSGIEKFEPEINSDYRGQEKFAEAIKEKQRCDNPGKIGKIAKVVRPGYQYFISEDNIKVVRTAKVQLYG